MKEKDLLILTHLRADARIALTDMSKKTEIPVSTIFDKIKQHETNVIKKYTAIVDFEKLGYSSKSMMIIKTEIEMRDILKEYLLAHNNVNNIYQTNSEYDFVIETIFRNMKDTQNFIEELERNFEMKSIRVFNLIEDINRENFLAKK